MLWIAVRQVAVDVGVLAVLLIWGVYRGDDRVERWVGRRWGRVKEVLGKLREKRLGFEGAGRWWFWEFLRRFVSQGRES